MTDFNLLQNLHGEIFLCPHVKFTIAYVNIEMTGFFIHKKGVEQQLMWLHLEMAMWFCCVRYMLVYEILSYVQGSLVFYVRLLMINKLRNKKLWLVL